jgi:hypothetical protein
MKFKFTTLLILAIAGIATMGALIIGSGDYQGTESCADCHSKELGNFPGYDKFAQTLHTTIHEVPKATNMVGDFTKEVDMGSAYSNAKVGFRMDAGKYYIVFKPKTGNQQEHEVIYTYGKNWKQRYLVKIENSYYMPPVQWNLNGYKDNSSGTWVTYNPANWWNADGTLKPLNNAFRSKSWDKNCAGCHVVPGKKEGTVEKVITGQDTAWVYHWANNNSHVNIAVGCESCHGYPTANMGKGHVNNLKGLSYDRKLEVCGQCHTRGVSNQSSYEYPYDESTNKTYVIGEDLMKYYILKPGLFADKESSRQHHQQWVDYKLSGHYDAGNGITCVTCHDPHQNTNFSFQMKKDFRSTTAGQGCLSCHSDKAEATNGINKHSKHPQAVSLCVSCHMTKTAGSGKGFDISGHSFRVISPEATIKYKDVTTPVKGMPNSCALSCHRNGKGTFGTGTNFGITDASLSDWTESTDQALADSLLKYYKIMFPGNSVEVTYGNPSSNTITSNYPNPFSNNTKFNFNLLNAGNVKIEIYSIKGERVNIISNEYMMPGSYTVTWNGTAVNGFDVPTGNYICVMSLNGVKTSTRSIVKIR